MKTVLEILAEIRPEFDFSASEDFIDDGMLDSFDVIMLVSALDSTFSISIDALDIRPENLRNLEAIEVLLRRYGVTA